LLLLPLQLLLLTLLLLLLLRCTAWQWRESGVGGSLLLLSLLAYRLCLPLHLLQLFLHDAPR
jgi:hypothetical protein